MDRLEEIRQRAAAIPLVGPLTVALKRYDDGELACEISRMAKKDIPALLDIAAAALAKYGENNDKWFSDTDLEAACRRFREAK